MKNILFIFALLLRANVVHAQISGCTDSKANNFNPLATVNNGSCTYNGSNLNPTSTKTLNSALAETSGLIHWNNEIWSHNDDTNNKLYSIDTATAAITQSYTLYNTINKDWEEISQDDNYIYVGDFGNNSNGNRTDLHILRVDKNSLLFNAPIIDTIFFTYSNQTNFNATGANNTNFDCEAFLVTSDSIYLFTKQWISEKTSIYALPKTPGNYVASLRSTINIQGLATGITYLESKRLAVICGYSKLLQPFFYLLYDFVNNEFANGNKRKVNVNLGFHQIEGIATSNGLKYYASNEGMTSPINNPQKLHTFDLTNLLGNYLKEIPTSIHSLKNKTELSVFPNPANDYILLQARNITPGTFCTISDLIGKNIISIQLKNELTTINTKTLPSGIYLININGTDEIYKFIRN